MSNEVTVPRTQTAQGSFVVEVDASRPAVGAAATLGRYRWVICGLLFFATTINYIDRQVMGSLRRTCK